MKTIYLLLVAVGGTVLIAWLLRHSLPSAPPLVKIKMSQACETAYSHLYQNVHPKFRVVFGYKDSRPHRFVGDRYERAAFVNQLLSPCTANSHACGFSRDGDDADLFRKKITGPDGMPRWVEIEVNQPAAGPDDDENRRDSFQPWLSRHAEASFLDGLSHNEVVLYNGHSRDGGGPDFDSPRVTHKGGGVDYYWYKTHQPGVAKLIQALKGPESKLNMLGLFSCVSTSLFSKAVHTANASVALISSAELLYYADALKNQLGALSSLLGMACEKDFEESISSSFGQKKARLEGFFSQAGQK